MKKPKYFDVIKFVDEVVEAMKLNKTNTLVVQEIREAVIDRLADRIMATVFSAFGTREVKLIRQLVMDHPEMDELDAIMIISKEIDGLGEKLDKNIKSLFEELTYDAQRIENTIEAKKVAKST